MEWVTCPSVKQDTTSKRKQTVLLVQRRQREQRATRVEYGVRHVMCEVRSIGNIRIMRRSTLGWQK